MELFQLEAFLAVVREGSFSAAAKALYPHPAGDQPDHQEARGRDRPAAVRSLEPARRPDRRRARAGRPRRAAGQPAPARDGGPGRRAAAEDRPADDGRERADVLVPVTDSARVPAALSGSAHHGAARARQPRAGAGARLRRRLRRDHLPSRHRRRSTRSSSITTSSRSWCRRRIRWRGDQRCRSASWRASRSSRITCRRRIGRK